MSSTNQSDPFAHLKQRAGERADRTVARLRTGIAQLQATGQKITADSIRQITRELEPGFSGLSFQVIRRNTRAYALYREAADAFSRNQTPDRPRGRRRRRGQRAARSATSSYDPLQRLDKKQLVHRIRALELELETERQRRAELAYDRQLVMARILRLETDIILLQSAQ